MSKALATKNVAAALIGLGLVFGLAFSFATPAKADTLSDLQAQVQALLAQIASLQGGSSMSTSGGACFTFTQTLTVGANGSEVMQLQKFLNAHGAVVASTGAGSPGNETSYFGNATKAAVAKWQAANGVSPAAGYWGPLTRAKANGMCTSGSMTGGTTGGTTTPTGPGISVSAGVQPANSLAPASASRVPFTTFTLTNNSGAAATITGVQVQRTGLAQDAAFSGVVLVDSNGLQVGVSRTFDSNHQATIGDTITLAAGQSATFTVAGNMAASEAAYAGEVAGISVIGVNTSVPVSGSLPISGAQQTINATLTLGTVTANISTFDPNGAVTKHIGDTGIKFTGIRLTAGSAEDLKLYSIRWRVNGSVSPSDLANVVTVVNGTSYPTVLSTDGRYYTSTFPGGILVQKGFSADAYIQGDIVGSNASGRVAEFDIDKASDVYMVGQLYGYGIALPAGVSAVNTGSTHGTFYTSGQPIFQGSTVSIQGGTVTTIGNAPAVTSQNIAINVPNQPLGGFLTNFAGEPVTVQTMTFKISSTGTTSVSEIQSASIVDENGAVVAGPVDAVGSVLTFSNSVTFPVGQHTYTIKGKIPSTGWNNNATVQLNTTPSSWTGVQGQTTGNSITIGTANFTMNTMTVRAANLTETASANPASQSVVAGGQGVLLANIQLDASQSGEDVRLSNLQINESGTANPNVLNTCQLWNGTSAVNTGSNVLNTVAQGQNTVTFDNALSIPKGTVVTLGLTCNISSSATSSSTFIFGVSSSGFTGTGTGAVSGNSVTPTVTTTNSGTMTVATGALTVSVDSSSPSYTVAAGGTTGVTMGVIKLRPTGENLNLTKLGLTLTSGAAADLGTVYLYQGSTLVGTAYFTGTNTTATSTLTTPVTLAKDTDNLITVKADLADIGSSQPGVEGALISIDPLNYEATGQSSGLTVRGGASTGVAGVRAYNTFPTLALDTLPTTGVADGRLMHFKVTADSHGNVGLGQFTFTIATTTLNVSNVQLFGFTDASYSSAISGQGTSGQIGSTITPTTTGATFVIAPTSNPVQVPAGQTYYFELRGSVSGVATGASEVTTLKGDSSGGAIAAFSQGSGNILWSPNATTTAATTSGNDWATSYGVAGLPSGGLIQTRSN